MEEKHKKSFVSCSKEWNKYRFSSNNEFHVQLLSYFPFLWLVILKNKLNACVMGAKVWRHVKCGLKWENIMKQNEMKLIKLLISGWDWSFDVSSTVCREICHCIQHNLALKLHLETKFYLNALCKIYASTPSVEHNLALKRHLETKFIVQRPL